MNFTLSQEDYEAMVSLARRGLVGADSVRNFEAFLQRLEKQNGVTRSALWVQWQEADAPLPPEAEFPRTWPPNMRAYIEFISRPVTRQDVDAVVKSNAKKPVGVLVTTDPAAVVGWTKLEDYFAP